MVHPNYHGRGIGRQIVELLLAEAGMLEISRVFALTRKPDFFLKLDFRLTRIEKLPRKVRRDCVFCPKFHACDEVAVVISPQEITVTDLTSSIVKRNGPGPQQVISSLVKTEDC